MNIYTTTAAWRQKKGKGKGVANNQWVRIGTASARPHARVKQCPEFCADAEDEGAGAAPATC